jgi:hypothetical protein
MISTNLDTNEDLRIDTSSSKKDGDKGMDGLKNEGGNDLEN